LKMEMNVAPLGACATWTLPPGRHTKPVGWVERSDTHQLPFAKMMGFAKGSTHPTDLLSPFTPAVRRYIFRHDHR